MRNTLFCENEKMSPETHLIIERLLTVGTVLFNVGYQVPQILLLRQRARQKENGSKSPLNANTILIKTTGLYIACSYFILNEVPVFSWIHQITSILQDWMMIYYW